MAGPSTADPSIGDVQDRVDQLYHQAEQASERYNQARIELTDARHRLHAVRTDLERQRARTDEVRDQVAAAVVAQYQGQGLTSATQVLLSDDPDTFISQLTTMSEYDARQAGIIDELRVEADRLELREEVARRELDKITRAKTQLAEEKKAIDERMAEAKSLLGKLQAEQREVRASRSGGRMPTAPTTTAPASGGAAAAISYAMAQVGDSYVYGAAGPDAFDCSGLTMMAWAQAGVALPHSSSAQMGSGTPVSTSSLQPGDLVFYYSPVSHVALYIGNGMIVHAANPSTGVVVAPMGSMPISGAVRPG
jgi:cell wall-associated NlpC family hydrolase